MLPAGSPRTHLLRLAGSQWRALTEAEKKPYEETFTRLRRDYEDALQRFRDSEQARLREHNANAEGGEVLLNDAHAGRSEYDRVLCICRKEGYMRQFMSLFQNPKLSGVSEDRILAALRVSRGAVVGARKILFGVA